MSKANILIVEDELIIAAVIEGALKKFNYAVVGTVISGEEAVKKALILRPDLILMDIRLQGEIDGVEAAERIQSELDIPIIYLTAYADEKTLERAKRTQPYAYIPKPFQEIELKTAIEVGLYKHQMERRIKESEEKFRSIFENSPDPIYTADAEGHLLDINPAGVDLLGRAKSEILSKPTDDLYVHSGTHTQFIRDLKRQVKVQNYEIDLKKANGNVIHILENACILFDKKGQVSGIQGILRDITEKKKQEEQLHLLQTAINHSVDALIITDPNGRIVYTNPAFERITGFKNEEAIGNNPNMLKSDRQPAALYHQMWEIIARGSSWSGELINRRKDGMLYNQRTSISPVFNEKKVITHYVGIATDMTRERKLEEQLGQAAKMDSLGRLAGGIAHDFNNLLVVINGYAEMMLFEDADEKTAEKIKMILKAGQSATRLVNKILAFSRRQSIDPGVLSINELISDFSKMLQRIVGEGIDMKLDLAQEVPTIWMDAIQLEQVIMNLVINAKDAMPSGGVLTIATSRRQVSDDFLESHPDVRPGEYVEMRVSDSGVGIPLDMINRIFEPFFSTKERGEGTGLGLSIVYGIIKQNNGFLQVGSDPGKGTAISLNFPVYIEKDADARPIEVAKSVERFAGKTVLLVEDDESARMVLHDIFVKLGFSVLVARDGEEAVELAGKTTGRIDLLFCDVVLPGMSGKEAAEAILQFQSHMVVLFASGYPSGEIVHRGVNLGAYHLLRKPTNGRVIKKKLDEIFPG